MELELDFRADMAAKFRFLLAEDEIDFDPSLDLIELSYIYWNVKFRTVVAQPRNVILAPDLEQPQNQDDAHGFATLKAAFLAGLDVNAYQSKAFVDADHRSFDDMLFNDWGIQHFHLGRLEEGKRFVKRTKNLLFALVKPKEVFLIALKPHKDPVSKIPTWVHRDLIQRVHKNWPHLIARSKVEAFTDRPPHSDQDLLALRKGGVTVFTQMDDGSLYVSPGGGYMSTGLSARVADRSDHMMATLASWEKQLRTGEHVAAAFAEKGKAVPDRVKLSLHLDEEGVAYAWDYEHEVSVKLGVP